ncbi:hypothetical protein LOC68_20760 [Blastopirellula sp. JC732]|uniref:Uncharacterized protein n=1 Tax=Blastopirellula sediminis TaxID=2894196 RepID=A0A9X1MRR5_9BACT|nr:hypothetical protein [Blastopirellula sediminis]MCC9605869.1 hypothetical protein [Blastopirellula sediminis]MCC9630832.1 hypothetical protein [Blastopirellula sediminis]
MTNFNLHNVWGAVGFAVLMAALVGCGKSDGMIKVTGNVMFNGEPVENGSISFTPVDGRGSSGGGLIENGQIVRGKSSPGNIAVQIYANKTVEKKNPTREEIERGITSDQVQILPATYNRQSKLRITISDSERHFDFDLNDKGEIPAGMTGT